MLHFSVIVPTYNRAELLLRTLQALRNQTHSPLEIIVVDDGSSDDTGPRVQTLAQQPGAPIHYLRQDNRGPAAARNRAIRECRGQWVAMTDDDTIPDPGWLAAFAECLESHPDWVGVEGLTFCPDPEPLGHWVENLRGGQFITANMAYSRQVLLEVGGLDEQFPFPKCEDTELAWRCGRVGTIGFCPQARVCHPNRPQTGLTYLRQARYELSEFVLARKLGPDYKKYRRLPTAWSMIGLIYFLVPLRRGWRFRRYFAVRPAKLAEFALLSGLRPLFFLAYWLRARGRRVGR